MSAVSSRSDVWRERETVVSLGGRQVPLLVPTKQDPRLIEIGGLVVALVVRMVAIHPAPSALHILAALVTAVVLDVVLTYARQRRLVVPASALITGAIVALILKTSAVGPFALAAALAILSKHLIRTAGRHMLNPAAFGLTVVLLAFPSLVHTVTHNWTATFLVAPFLIMGGAIATKQAESIDLAMWFIPIYMLGVVVDTVATHGSALSASNVKGTVFAVQPVFLIFAFYLLTDPRTAPRAKMGRRLYAIMIALLGVIISVPGLDRMVSLLVALLVGNLVAALVLDKYFAKEEEPAVPPSPIAPFEVSRLPHIQTSPETGRAAAEAPPALREAPAASSAETQLLPARDSAPIPQLVIRGAQAMRCPLSSPEMTVGRAPDNAVRLEASGVSRHHAVLKRAGQRVVLVDLGSSNGTFVNGVKVSGSIELHDGDRIDFGGMDVGAPAVFVQVGRATERAGQ